MYISPNINLASVASATDMATALADLTALAVAVPLAEQRKLIAGGPGTITHPDGANATFTEGAGNTYGAWGQLVAATGSALLIIGVYLETSNGDASYAQCQIGVGAGGAEVVQTTVVSPTHNGGATMNGSGYIPLVEPLPVPTGARIAARGRSNAGALVWGVRVHAVDPAQLQKWSA